MELWVDKKVIHYILLAISISAAILGSIVGAIGFTFLHNEILDRIVGALIGAFIFYLFATVLVGLLALLVLTPIQGIKNWFKVRKIKMEAYYMIENGRIDTPEQFKEVVSILRKNEDREARHLLNDLYELEQIPDKDEEDELDEEVEKMKGRVEMVRLEDLDDLKSGCAWVGCQETCPIPKEIDAVDSLPEGWRFLVVAKDSLFDLKNLLNADVDGVLCPKHYKELLSLLKKGGIIEGM